ncbi:MAG TPA: hypothetical protein PL084_01775 [Chitinophagales bacterium]|nr:hypothetical protein [Chitinophagales bacterium]HRP38511.1 hypothetical protein [Chitinophagales bacterium]
MNELLLQKIKNLSEADWQQLLGKIEQSLLLKKLAQKFREWNSEPLKTKTLVLAVYGKQDMLHYTIAENRFYKLRKKLYEIFLQSSKTQSSHKLAQEEMAKEFCKQLMDKGEIAQAAKALETLEQQCFSNNIFELLPEISDMRIQAAQALNRFSETKKMYSKFEEATELYIALSKQKLLARRIYEVNVQQGIGATQSYFKQMDIIARTHKNYPRFRLIYNFVAAYYKAGSGGKNSQIKSYAIARHFAAATKIMNSNPNIPIISFSADFQQKQQFKIKELEAIFLFKQLRFKEAAAMLNELLKSAVNNTHNNKKMLNEILITNTIHANILAQDSQTAFATVQHYFSFLRDNNYASRIPRAFCELANVASTLHILPKNFDAKNILKNINLFIDQCKKQQLKELETAATFLKAQTLLLVGKKIEARKIFETDDVKAHFKNKEIQLLFYAALYAILNKNYTQKAALIKQFKKAKYSFSSSEDTMVLTWIECAITKYFH